MAQPKPYPGDEYIKQLCLSLIPIKRDINNNVIIGSGVSIDGVSVGNYVVADNAQIIKSHNNILNAKNVVIQNSSGCRIDGADHTVIGANYASCDGDAHTIEGYGSSTTGSFNKNSVENGIAEGANLVLGKTGFPNQFSNSSLRGQNCILEGSNSHGVGSFLKIMGNNIIAVGNGSVPGYTLITEPGFHVILNGVKVN